MIFRLVRTWTCVVQCSNLITSVQQVLQSTRARPSGGFEFVPAHVLNVVLLCDNVVNVDELKSTTQQSSLLHIVLGLI